MADYLLTSPSGHSFRGPPRVTIRGILFLLAPAVRSIVRTAFLVDGYNLYHSLVDASERLGGAGTRWLDLSSFCRSLLAHVGSDATLQSITYFSAVARHRELESPGTVTRHRDYLACLEATGILVELGHFKRKPFQCPHCAHRTVRHEEKETDVAIASSLLAALQTNYCDVAVLMTGDSDQAPAIRTSRRLFPEKRVLVCFPFNRVRDELKRDASGHFKVSAAHYVRHQFPDPFANEDGRSIPKPSGW